MLVKDAETGLGDDKYRFNGRKVVDLVPEVCFCGCVYKCQWCV